MGEGGIGPAGQGRRIRTEEVLRYLGHGGQAISPDLAARIEQGIARCEGLCDPRWLWRVFEVAGQAGEEGLASAGGQDASDPASASTPDPASAPESVAPAAPGRAPAPASAPAPVAPRVLLAGASLALEGASVCDFLAGATHVALLACTLGAAADRELRRLAAVDALGQVIFDAACTDLVEWGADAAGREIAAWGRERGLVAGDRFSPGYADFPLSVQARFLDVLQAQKRLGLTVNESSLLVPTKSVTCVVGLYPSAPERGRHLGCGACNLWQTCQMRLRGTPCWRRP